MDRTDVRPYESLLEHAKFTRDRAREAVSNARETVAASRELVERSRRVQDDAIERRRQRTAIAKMLGSGPSSPHAKGNRT